MISTPLHIRLLIHYHCFSHLPTYCPDAPSVIDYTEELRANQFIYPDESKASGFVTSIKGRDAIRHMLDLMDTYAPIPIDSTADLPGISQEVGAKEPTHLIVEANVRYWEDATVNGQEDTEGLLVPFREGDLWKPVIELATGRVINWPEGTTADIHYKVCDAGEYWLGTEKGEKLLKWEGDYVPDRFLTVGDGGYGDYIILDIDGAGEIEGWKTPDIDEEEWQEVGA